jgi:phosphoribosyl 1,2-cyclic phosphate phosphodiesterase
MKIRYWGTAAAEGIPALFCDCKVCKEARKMGGRYVRMRSQIMIEDKLLLDFGPDTYSNCVRFGFDLSAVSDALISHVHEDHFYPVDLYCRQIGMGTVLNTPTLTLHGSEDVEKYAMQMFSIVTPNDPDRLLQQNRIAFHELKPYETYDIAGMQITPLPARHNTPHPFVYIVEQGGRVALIMNDSGYFSEETMSWLKEKGLRFDLISYDCTHGAEDAGEGSRHMGVPNNLEMKKRFEENGNCDGDTLHVITHFSHNIQTVGYGEMEGIAKANGFILAYDGLEIEI